MKIYRCIDMILLGNAGEHFTIDGAGVDVLAPLADAIEAKHVLANIWHSDVLPFKLEQAYGTFLPALGAALRVLRGVGIWYD